MRPYVIAGIGTAIIICVVAILWLGWGINTADFTTNLAVGLILIIPVLCAWAYNKERAAKQYPTAVQRNYWQWLKKLKPKKYAPGHSKFSGLETNPEKIDEESKRQREDKWLFFPSNYK
jgi:hypothetical protein